MNCNRDLQAELDFNKLNVPARIPLPIDDEIKFKNNDWGPEPPFQDLKPLQGKCEVGGVAVNFEELKVPEMDVFPLERRDNERSFTNVDCSNHDFKPSQIKISLDIDETHNPRISSSVEERASLGYKFVINDVSEEELVIDSVLNEKLYVKVTQENLKPPTVVQKASNNKCKKKTLPKLNVRKTFFKDKKGSPSAVNSKKCHSATPKIKVFTCDRCNSSYLSEEELRGHLVRTNVCAEPFSCYLCSYTTHKCATVKLHLAFEHNQTETYSCFYCSHVTGSRLSVKKHILSNHSSFSILTRSPIIIKNKSFCTPKIIFKKTPYICHHCLYSTNSKHNVKLHIRQTHRIIKHKSRKRSCPSRQCKQSKIR